MIRRACCSLTFAMACAAPAATPSSSPESDAAAQAPSPAEGTYSSPRGIVHLRQDGDRVSGEYVCAGTVEGEVADDTVSIRWTSPDGGGKARWSVGPDGTLTGTWTHGPEDAPGGDWNLTPRGGKRSEIGGTYDSGFGPVELARDGDMIRGTYECPGGTIVGTRAGDEIRFAWQGSDSMGHGEWTLTDGGAALEGTWGFGPSADAGGPWNLERTSPDAPPAPDTHAGEAGTMHPGVLLDAIVEHHESFRRCVNEALESKVEYPARLNISITIAPAGTVSRVSVDPAIDGRQFDACLVEELRSWTFEPFEGDAWSRTFPYVFASVPDR